MSTANRGWPSVVDARDTPGNIDFSGSFLSLGVGSQQLWRIFVEQDIGTLSKDSGTDGQDFCC